MASPSAQSKTLLTRLSAHDSYQWEAKIDYAIAASTPLSRYRVEVYFFLPRSLGIFADTYRREDFYSDLQTYIRFRAPHLAAPADSGMPTQALAASYRALQAWATLMHKQEKDAAKGEDKAKSRVRARQARRLREDLDYEWRFFGCGLRAHIRRSILPLQEEVKKLSPNAAAQHLGQASFTDTCRQLLAHCAALFADFAQLQEHRAFALLPKGLRQRYAFVAEYVSLSYENYLTGFLSTLQERWQGQSHPCPAATLLKEAIVAEQQRRQQADAFTESLTGPGRAFFLYRRGLLKKFVMSALFLDVQRFKEHTHADLFAAVAAGVAMFFATVAAILTQQWYALNSLPFVMALVFSYVLKDRIKDWLKHYFSAKLTRWLWDFNVDVLYPRSNTRVGRCREAFAHLASHEVPAEIRAVRAESLLGKSEQRLARDTVMRYEKDIWLRTRHIAQLEPRLSDIYDIIRFNIRSFLQRADDPLRPLHHFDAARDAVASVNCSKVYPLDLVFVLINPDAPQSRSFASARVVLDKQGIRTLEANLALSPPPKGAGLAR